jgi:hypothetical protein
VHGLAEQIVKRCGFRDVEDLDVAYETFSAAEAAGDFDSFTRGSEFGNDRLRDFEGGGRGEFLL